MSNPVPKRRTNSTSWRALEASLRVLWVWPYCFFNLLSVEEFSPATRLLLLAALPDHAKYIRKCLTKGGNILVMQLNSVLNVGALWPEFKESATWIRDSYDALKIELLEKQVYEDGIQKELSNHYHYVTVINFQHSLHMAEKGGIQIDLACKERLWRMWEYYAYTTRPDGFGLLNNDSDRDDHRDNLIMAAKKFNEPFWEFIAKNGSLESKELGIDRVQKTSFVSPWAGHLISRNNWQSGAQWSFFDFGPYGTGHQHRDKLHFSCAVFGADFLVDSGRYHYIRDNFRKKYFQETCAHNTILFDGRNQTWYQKATKTPIPEITYETAENYDFAIGKYDAGYKRCFNFRTLVSNATHTRSMVYVKDFFWVIVDRILPKALPLIHQNYKIETLWHFHPECNVDTSQYNSKTETGLHAQRTEGNLSLIPLEEWKYNLIRGKEEPSIQGWWSREYNHKTPAICSVCSTTVESEKVFTWIIIPWLKERPNLDIVKYSIMNQSIHLEVAFEGQKIAINLPISLKHSIPRGKIMQVQE